MSPKEPSGRGILKSCWVPTTFTKETRLESSLGGWKWGKEGTHKGLQRIYKSQDKISFKLLSNKPLEH